MNKTIMWISIVAILLVACKAKTTESAESAGSKTTDLIVNPDAMVQLELSVDGMTCTGCENTINEGVSQIAGVIEVKSSFQNGITIVKFDSTLTNIDKISQVINEKGYEVKGFAVHNTEEVSSPAPE
jgi:mercuric ion transport protein